MADQKVSATRTDDDRVVSVVYDFGDDLASAVEKFGEEAVYSRFKSSSVIDLQSLLRRQLITKEGEEAKSDADIQAMVSDWKPGDKTRVQKSASDKVLDIFDGVSEDEKLEILKKLEAKAT